MFASTRPDPFFPQESIRRIVTYDQEKTLLHLPDGLFTRDGSW